MPHMRDAYQRKGVILSGILFKWLPFNFEAQFCIVLAQEGTMSWNGV